MSQKMFEMFFFGILLAVNLAEKAQEERNFKEALEAADIFFIDSLLSAINAEMLFLAHEAFFYEEFEPVTYFAK